MPALKQVLHSGGTGGDAASAGAAAARETTGRVHAAPLATVRRVILELVLAWSKVSHIEKVLRIGRIEWCRVRLRVPWGVFRANVGSISDPTGEAVAIKDRRRDGLHQKA